MISDNFLEEQWKEPTNLDDATKMIRKIKELFPIAGIIWQPEDAFVCATQHDLEIDQAEAEEAIQFVEDNKDCEFGITWEHLYQAIQCIVDDRP